MDESENASGTKAPGKAVDRVALGKDAAEKVSAWLKQLEVSSSGFLQLSRSDVVNFLINEHKTELSPREMQQIRSRHYDPIRHLNWITPRLKEALQAGDMAAIAALQAEIRSIELSVINRAKEGSKLGEFDNSPPKPKRRRIKKTDASVAAEPLSIAEIQGNLSEG